MLARLGTVITLLIGFGIGALITPVSFAALTRSVYVITEVDDIVDASQYSALKDAMAGIVEAQFQDGRFLARSDNITPLDGPAPKAIAIIAFESEAKARAYHENMRDLSAARAKASKARSFMVSLCTERGKLAADCGP